MITPITIGLVCFFLGTLVGFLLDYILLYRSLDKDHERLKDFNRICLDRIYKMKLQGFVPQFDIEQRKPLDPSDGIVEY